MHWQSRSSTVYRRVFEHHGTTVCDSTFPSAKRKEHSIYPLAIGAEGRFTANRAACRTRTEPSTMADPQEEHEDDGEVRPRLLPLFALYPRGRWQSSPVSLANKTLSPLASL